MGRPRWPCWLRQDSEAHSGVRGFPSLRALLCADPPLRDGALACTPDGTSFALWVRPGPSKTRVECISSWTAHVPRERGSFPLLWTILTSVILYTALAAVLILLLVFQLNKINAYRTYLLDQHLFSSRQIEVLQKEVTKLSKQLSVLKKRFARAREEMQSEGSEGETSFAPTPSVHSRASSVAVPRKSVRIDADRAAQSDNRAEP
ncbi:unnamed protein product [Vitrella brassicaformis CCMP3155]|uniref:Uncharacterized protein n=1 Tax=Vitrella brassicaformis (strain CCMP3155) TaxID=1169540 RepID=A0A0G4EV49_VITBC|nr:unnamed protein product [Vitrella brassicaformis CCMP3155]|eukprot:CEM01927.1 unnamed protein product [Vitrella brassicaformis CCMP3155]